MVSWIGGEPLLWKPIWDITRKLKQEFGIQVSATTNGVLLNRPNVRLDVCQYFDEVTISIDGVGDIHDNNRSQVGLYDNILENISAISKMKARNGKGPLIRVNTILMQQNINSFEKLYVELSQRGVDEMTFNVLGGNNHMERYLQQQLTREQIADFHNKISELRVKYPDSKLSILGSDTYFERISLQVENVKVPISDCKPGRQYLFVDENGNIGPCAYTTRDFCVNIRNIDSVDMLMKLPLIYSNTKSQHMFASCFDCPSTNIFGKFKNKIKPR